MAKRCGSVKMGILDKLFGKSQQGRHYDYEEWAEEEEYKKCSDRIIGIDLGTSNSSVAVLDVKTGRAVTIPSAGSAIGGKIFPSCVAFRGDGEILIGDAAKRQAVMNPEGTVMAIKRKIGTDHRIRIHGKEYTPQLISAFILRKIKQDADAFIGMPVSNAVVTVPTYFNDRQRQATKDACTAAGFDSVRILSESTAAALTCGIYEPEAKIMVFHFGGGTADVTIIEFGEGVFEVISTSGDTKLGGIDMDNKIIDYIATEFKKKTGLDLKSDKVVMERLREAAEASKIELSSVNASNINLPYIIVDSSDPKHLDMALTREKLEELVRPITEKLKEPIYRALSDAKLKPKDVDRVILVGEPTHMPIVQDTIKNIFGDGIKYNILPKEYVAMGAAIEAGVLSGETKDGALLLDVTPLSIGIETSGGMFNKLIDRNTTIPVTRSMIFSTAVDNQNRVEIHVLQGERPVAKENTTMCKFHITGIRPASKGLPQIEVTFDIDADGILQVSAKDIATENMQDIKITSSAKSYTEQMYWIRRETERFANNCKKRSDDDEIRHNSESLIYTSEKSIKDLGNGIEKDQKEAVESSINALKKALESNDLVRIKRKTEELKNVCDNRDS